MHPIVSLPLTISQMSPSDRDKFPIHGADRAWTTDRALFIESHDGYAKDSYEEKINGMFHKPYYQFFKKFMESLTIDNIWFDAGCGNGTALIRYVEAYENGATVHGVTLTRPKNKKDEFQMVEEDKNSIRLHIYLHDFLTFPTRSPSLHGRVSVITDIFGAFNYCGRPSDAFKKFAEMLKVGGLLFLVLGDSNTVDVTSHKNAIANAALYSRGSNAFFYLYLTTVRGFKALAPEDASPASIQKIFSVRSEWHLRSQKGYEDRSWIMVRTEESFDADPLYIKGGSGQCDESIASTASYRKYHWEVSDKNKVHVENMKEIIM